MLFLLGVLACIGSCKHKHFPSRGDAAAVVVVAPRNDAAGPPKVAEQEPNDNPEQAQLLSLNPDWPVLTVEGLLPNPGEAKGKDVDVFKLLVPGNLQDSSAQTPPDSGLSEDPRLSAKRLSIEISASGSAALSLQLLDDGLKSIESVGVEPGDVAGMPNMAGFPGRTYYLRVKVQGRANKKADPSPAGNAYKLTIQLGDFEIAEEREPNDSLETAQALSLVGTADFAGLFGWPGDQDFYRIPAPAVASALDIEVDAVDGVASGVQVLDGGGTRIASGRGRRGERVALHNVTLPAVQADAGAGARSLYVVVRGESGHNLTQRYVLHLSLGMIKQGAEIEPNDDPSSATEVHDGNTTGFLPVGDVDFFRYTGDGPREVTIEMDCPSRVRGRIQVIRPSDGNNGQVIASAAAKRARKSVVLDKIPTLGQPLLIRVGQGKWDGNPNQPYMLKITSTAVPIQKDGVTNSPSPLNPD